MKDLLAWPYRQIARRYDHKVPATGLAVFRVAYSLVLLAEIVQLYVYRHLIFDPVPYLVRLDNDIAPALLLWMLAAICLGLGLGTRLAAVANYTLTLVTLSTFDIFEYHYDYVLVGTNFLWLFLPGSAALSLDRWLARRRRPALPAVGRVTRLSYDLPILVGLGFVYFDSVFHKLASGNWLRGLGLWVPASLPQITLWDASWLVDRHLLMLAAGYLTLIFEATFLFLFFRRRWRLPLLAIGIGLHLGIVLLFPIPLFGLGAASFYLLMVPFACWRRWWPDSTLAADAEERPWDAVSLTPGLSVRRLRLLAITTFLAVLVSCQLLSTWRAPSFSRWWPAGDGFVYRQIVAPAGRLSRTLFGITPHPVFMDYHFAGYEHLVTLVYRQPDGGQNWLPLLDADGHPAFPAWGRIFIWWGFRVAAPTLEQPRLIEGMQRATAFWAGRRGIDLTDAEFRVLVKKIDTPDGWQRGFLRRQLAQPWIDAGAVYWRDGRFGVAFADLEEL